MEKKTYKCAICRETIAYKPARLDYKKYENPYRDYQTIIHYNFCKTCWNSKVVPELKKLYGVKAKRKCKDDGR